MTVAHDAIHRLQADCPNALTLAADRLHQQVAAQPPRVSRAYSLRVDHAEELLAQKLDLALDRMIHRALTELEDAPTH